MHAPTREFTTLALTPLILLTMLTSCATVPGPGSDHWVGPPLNVERLELGHDEDRDGIDDLQDIVMGARAEVARQPRYHSAYYEGGYPPADEGVCTDLVWRALRDAGYNLKEMLDRDVQEHPGDYPSITAPDPNIDFRRIRNMIPFFQKYATVLTTDVHPGDAENLVEWQGGDIVVFGGPHPHIGIVSDKRKPNGVPLVIHNSGPYPKENDALTSWPAEIVHHFRFPMLDN